LQENAKYCVITRVARELMVLVFETVDYDCKLLGFKCLEILVFDAFLSKTQNQGVFLLTLFKKDFACYEFIMNNFSSKI